MSRLDLFSVPDRKLAQLTFSAADTTAINHWAANLPLVNTDETAAQLFNAIQELAALDAQAGDKLDYLEVLRPLTHYVCSRMDRKDRPREGVDFGTEALLISLCVAYKSIWEACEEDTRAQKDLLARTLHRLATDLSRILLRALQTYETPPAGLWFELNKIRLRAEELELLEFRCKDEENHSQQDMSIESAYMRALLIATCNPNQLRAQELTNVFHALENWSSHVLLSDAIENAPIIIGLSNDAGPQYARVAAKASVSRAIHTEVLAYEIEAYLKDVSGSISVPDTLTARLLSQLVDAWSAMKDRTFKRIETNTPIRVCVGLGAVHYFLSGGVVFNDQVLRTDGLLRREVNPFLDVKFEGSRIEDDDPWSQAHDLKVAIPENPNIEDPERLLAVRAQEAGNQEEEASPFDHHDAVGVDTSPGGYCLRWLDTPPPNTRIGEVVGLREELDPRWCVAVIRWISQEQNDYLMGVELLSPKAIPLAVRVIQKRGGPTDYARGLLLPEISVLNQPETLITPRMPFAAQQKIQLHRQGIQTTGQLLVAELKTQSFNQFTFRMLDGYLESNRAASNIGSLTAMSREDTTPGT
ncbi:MAG: hypothetical protein AAF513_04240 [Pseudomonadota bacterium]